MATETREVSRKEDSESSARLTTADAHGGSLLPMVLPRLILIAAALALPASASASVTKVTTPADDYLVGSSTPVTVKLNAAPKTGKVKVYVDGAQQGKPVAAAGKRSVVATAGFPKVGQVTVKGCLGKSCKSKKVRVHAQSSTPAPGSGTPAPITDPTKAQTYALTMTAGSIASDTVASRDKSADTFCGTYGYTVSSVKSIDGDLSTPSSGNTLTVGADGSVSGQAYGTTASTFNWPTLTGCKQNPNGPGIVGCTASHNDTGSSSIGFSIASIPGDSAHVTLRWTLPEADGGFADSGDDVCNVSQIAQYPPEDQTTTTVALADLVSGQPIALTNAGEATWDKDFQGKAASIHTTWTEKLTVQAVKQ